MSKLQPFSAKKAHRDPILNGVPPTVQGQHLHLHDELEEGEDGATRIAELDGTPATRIRQDNPQPL